MKNIHLLKFLLLGTFLTMSVFLCESSNAFTTCATTGSSTTNRISETSDCYTQPDVQQITFYKIAFCKSQPTAPTTSTAVDTSSCSTVFQNTGGSTINIQKGSTVNLTGSFTRPPNGTYSYVYVEISPTMKTKKTAYFVGNRTGTDGGVGTKCWSLLGNTYGYNTVNPVVTSCAADGATTTGLDLTTIYNNTLNGASGYVNTATFPTTYGGNLTAYLVDSANKLVATTARDSMGTISKIIGVLPETINLTHQERVSLIEMKYANATGTSVSMGGGTVAQFSGGPFDIYFAVKY